MTVILFAQNENILIIVAAPVLSSFVCTCPCAVIAVLADDGEPEEEVQVLEPETVH